MLEIDGAKGTPHPLDGPPQQSPLNGHREFQKRLGGNQDRFRLFIKIEALQPIQLLTPVIFLRASPVGSGRKNLG